MAFDPTVIESVAIAEQVTLRQSLHMISVFDSMDANESTPVIDAYFRNVSESLTVTEQTAVFLKQLFINVNEVVAMSEWANPNVQVLARAVLFLYNNLLDSATLTGSSAATGFPATNLTNPFRTKIWRTSGATTGVANLVIDHGAAKSVTCVALTGYSWTSAPAILNLEFNDTDSWGSPAHSETLTWYSSPTANGNKAVIIKIFGSQSYRFNRLSVIYSPGGVPTDWDLGRIFIGTYFEPTYSYSPNWSGEYMDESMGMQTIGGQEHFDEIEQYREFGILFKVDSQSQWESFQTMFLSGGIHKDLFVALDYEEEPDEMTIYGKLVRLPGMANFAPYGYNANFNLKESR